MPLNTAAAYGLFPQDAPLSDVVHTLNNAGFDNESICMMLSPTHPIASRVREASVFNSECESNDVTTALIGWLSEFGAVMIPTVGFFIRSQAFFRAFMEQASSAFCSNSRTLSGLGFSDDEADRFEHELRKVGVLVYVSCGEREKTTWACEVLRHTGAQEASTLAEKIEEKMSVAAAGAA
jgi:hypothetical protein